MTPRTTRTTPRLPKGIPIFRCVVLSLVAMSIELLQILLPNNRDLVRFLICELWSRISKVYSTTYYIRPAELFGV